MLSLNYNKRKIDNEQFFKGVLSDGILLFLGFISAQYTVNLYRYLKEWRNDPQWSFSCCLALLLPLSDLQGEIRGLAGTNILNNQLQTGQVETPTIQAAVKDSGAIDVTLEDVEQTNGNLMEDGKHQGTEYCNSQCHRGSQTDICALYCQYRGAQIIEADITVSIV